MLYAKYANVIIYSDIIFSIIIISCTNISVTIIIC